MLQVQAKACFSTMATQIQFSACVGVILGSTKEMMKYLTQMSNHLKSKNASFCKDDYVDAIVHNIVVQTDGLANIKFVTAEDKLMINRAVGKPAKVIDFPIVYDHGSNSELVASSRTRAFEGQTGRFAKTGEGKCGRYTVFHNLELYQGICDLSSRRTQDFQGCCDACSKTNGCQGWSFDPSNSVCWMKN